MRGKLGLGVGERVALVMRNSPQYLEALYAIWCAGLAAVPVNAKLHPLEVRYILENSQARLVLVTGDLRAGIREAIARLGTAPPVLQARGSAYAGRFAPPPNGVSSHAPDARP